MPPLRNHPASAAQNRFISLKILLALLLTLHAVQAKFALTEDAKFFTIDCESTPAVVVKVNKSNGNTHSKFYSAVRFIDDAIHGSRGDKIGAYFAIGSYESSSGGPFFRDINSQTAGDTEEIYFYMFSGHAQTEPFRKDQLHGPYALCFTEGPPPAMPAMNWMKDLGLRAWVSQRGRVTGTATRLLPGVPYTAYLSNEIAQYWTRIDANGKFTSTAMKPGTYSLRLMRNELAVAETQVTVTHADTASVQLQDPGLPSYLWRLGLPDGTPQGFRNASKMSDMHPSDKRHQAW